MRERRDPLALFDRVFRGRRGAVTAAAGGPERAGERGRAWESWWARAEAKESAARLLSRAEASVGERVGERDRPIAESSALSAAAASSSLLSASCSRSSRSTSVRRFCRAFCVLWRTTDRCIPGYNLAIRDGRLECERLRTLAAGTAPWMDLGNGELAADNVKKANRAQVTPRKKSGVVDN